MLLIEIVGGFLPLLGLRLPFRLGAANGCELPEKAVHQGDVGVAGDEAALLHLAGNGVIDGVDHAPPQVF